MNQIRASKLFGGCPTFFEDFQTAACSSEPGHAFAKSINLCICQNSYFEYYIDNLLHVARHWRFADLFTGVEADTMSYVLRSSNSALLKNQLSVAALEQYAKLFGKKWFDISHSLHGEVDKGFTAELRGVVKERPAKKIRNALSEKLRDRWDHFIDGGDEEVFAISVSLRHAFAHGEIWGAEQLEPHAWKLAICILDGIKKDVEEHTSRIG